MIRIVDQSHPVALTEQLIGILREQIRTGVLKPGQQLPSRREIAQRHQVSIGTVGNAVAKLVGEGLLRSRPQKGIFVAMAEAARQRVRTNIIGLAVNRAGDSDDVYISAIFQAILAAAVRRNINLLLVHIEGETPGGVDNLRSILASGRIDALIYPVFLRKDPRIIQLAQKHALPFVVLEDPAPELGGDMVVIDNRGGIERGVRHFAALGHRRIAFLGSTTASVPMRERLEGFRISLARLCLPADDRLVRLTDYAVLPAQAAMRELLSERPTAVVAVDDYRAYGAYLAAREAGLSVPRDLSIAGFGNCFSRERNAVRLGLRLTTTEVDLDGLGEACLDRIAARLRGEASEPICTTADAMLVVGETSGAVPEAACRMEKV